NRTAFLQRQRVGERIPLPSPVSRNQVRSLGRACKRLAVSRLRTDAVVVEGAGLVAPAVRADRSGCPCWTRSVDSCAADDQQACARRFRTNRTLRGAPSNGRAIRRGISPLLLDCSLTGRLKACSLSPARERRRGARRQRSRVAYDDLGSPLRCRCWTTSRNALQRFQPER